MTAVGSRYRVATFGLIPILLGTGFALTYHHGVEFGGLRLSSYATTLTFKIPCVGQFWPGDGQRDRRTEVIFVRGLDRRFASRLCRCCWCCSR
jgi:hypothetical protein